MNHIWFPKLPGISVFLGEGILIKLVSFFRPELVPDVFRKGLLDGWSAYVGFLVERLNRHLIDRF